MTDSQEESKQQLSDDEYERQRQEKREQSMRELSAMGNDARRIGHNRIIFGVIGVVILLYVIFQVGQCSKNTILGSHLSDARKEYCRNILVGTIN